MNMFAPIESRTDQQWRGNRYAAARGFARSGLSHKVVALRDVGKKATKSIYMDAFPELRDRLASNNPEYPHHVFLRCTVARLSASSADRRFCSFVGVLYFAASDPEICEFCERLARMCSRLVARGLEREYFSDALAGYGFDLGFLDRDGWEARASCPMFWRKQTRKLCGRKVETLAREIGLTHRRAGCYVSEFTYQRWLSACRRNQMVLEGLTATNDRGQEFGLDELAALGVSDPKVRIAELAVRVKGFHQWAEQDSKEWVPVFVTLTVPSRFHSHTATKNGPVVLNKKFDGSTPRDAMEWHTKRLARLRSRLQKREIRRFGFRIVEPHHDGCPHIHAVYFVAPDQVDEFRAQVELLWQEEPEKGSDQRRVEWVEIDPSRGNVVGYLMKYISKNIDGEHVGMDTEVNRPATVTAGRVRAWASVWGIRQFQQEGGPPVGVWRELRRAARQQEHLPSEIDRPEQFSLALESADEGDWCGYVEAMGGATASREEMPVFPFRVEREKAGRYGEPVKYVRGLCVCGFEFPILTRVREWVIQFATKQVAPKLAGIRSEIKAEAEKWVFRPPGGLLDLCQ